MEGLINKFYKELVNILPFKDAVFLAHLKSAGLFPGDLKEIVESQPTSASMTPYFLDHGINNDENSFSKLITVMEEFNSIPINDLANKIRKEIELWHSEAGHMRHQKSQPNLKELVRYSSEISDCWKRVALELDLPEEKVDNIDENNSNVQEKCYRMFSTWLKMSTNPTPCWCQIVSAIEMAGLQSVSKQIREHYIISDEAVATNFIPVCIASSNPGISEKPPVINFLSDYYRELYNVIRYDPEKADWPPNQIKLCVNVILIHYKNGRTQEELLEIAKRYEKGAAAIDDVATSEDSEPEAKRPRLRKQVKTLNDLFAADCAAQEGENTASPRRILIEGAPGIGKTVLAKEIAFLWANGKLLKEVTILFLLFLRDPKLWEVKTVKELVQFLTNDCALDDDKVADCAQTFLHSKNFRIAFVFDGLDEFPQNKNSFILKVIYGHAFPKAIIVCTSRPVASLCLHNYVDRRIEILGFTKEYREKYITLSLSDPDEKHKLEKYLKDNPMIDDLCFIPLHLAILMFLYKQGILPETLTELNELFVIHTIYRNLKRTHGQSTVSTVIRLTDLPKKELNVISKLSELAYLGLALQQLVFTSDEIMQICPEILGMPDAANGFGLLQAVPHYSKIGAGTTTSFSFLHLTMQEFLAAVHVSHFSIDEQFTLMDKTFWNGLFQYMWTMYIGIVGINSEAFVHFIDQYVMHTDSEVLFDAQLDEIKFLHLFQCYTEAKAVEMPKIISIFKDGMIYFHHVSFFQHNFFSLMSFLSKSNLQCKALTFNHCRVFRKNIINTLKWFVINNTDKISSLRYVNLCNNYSDTSSWVVFCAVIKYSFVEDLTLCGGFGAVEYYKDLNESLQCNTTLKSLTLCDTRLTDVERIKDILIETSSCVDSLNISTRTITPDKVNMTDHIMISTVMKKANDDTTALTLNVLHENTGNNSNSETLDLSYQTIKDHEIFYIAFGLRYNTTINVLKISHNEFTGKGVLAIRDCLLNNNVITELDMSSNNVLIKPIAEILLGNCSLLKLNISGTDINDNTAEIIGAAVKINNILQELNISHGQISPVRACFIAKGLCENTALQKLDISANEILDDGAMAICDCLKSNFSLWELNMSFNKITNRGAGEIAEVIRASTNLCKFNISDNRITSEGLIAFLNAIQINSTLKSLLVEFNNLTKRGLLEISKCVIGLNLSLKIYATWNDILIDHKLITVKTCCHYFNVHPCSEETGISDITLINWPLQIIKDINYAAELLSTCLKDNSTLTELNLSSIEVTPEGTKKLAETIKVNKTLKKLDISSKFIGDDGAVAISESLKDNTTLQDLSVAGVRVGSGEGIKQFINNIRLNTALVKLDLSSNWHLNSWDVINTLSSYLRNNTTLQELDLSSMSMIIIGLEEIIKALYDNKTLQKLVISNNLYFPWGKIISNLLQNNEVLLELDLSKCNIFGKDLREIAEGLQVNKTLQSLNISYNSIFDDGIVCLHKCLKVNCTLRKLDLSENDIKKEGGKLIGIEIIQFNKTLQQLNISINRLYDEAIEVISKYLQSNKNLQKLSISSCGITCEGAKFIAEALEANTTLKELDISCNRLGDIGVISIANSLKQNSIIQTLNLSSTRMSSSGAAQIAEALYVNTTLQNLDVSHNILQDNGVEVICECLKKNHTLRNLNASFTLFTSSTAIKFAETLPINTGLRSLNLCRTVFHDISLFNMTILKSIHLNNYIVSMKLPQTETQEMVKEIDSINQERAKQGVHPLHIITDKNFMMINVDHIYNHSSILRIL